MSNFFIIISILLNFISLFAILVLYLRQNRLMRLEKNHENMMKEVEEVISLYLVEIREDNEKFLQKFKQVNQSRLEKMDSKGKLETNNNETHIEPTNVKEIEKTEITEEIDNGAIRPVQAIRSQVVKAYQQNHRNGDKSNEMQITNSEKLLIEKESKAGQETILEEIISLKKQGKTNEEIARKLNKGKTEIQLLLKFSQNE